MRRLRLWVTAVTVGLVFAGCAMGGSVAPALSSC
jgi:hypothetical protein